MPNKPKKPNTPPEQDESASSPKRSIDEILNAPPPQKKHSPFDCIRDMRDGKRWEERNEEFRKGFSSFMARRILSLDPDFLQLLDDITQYKLSDEQFHNLVASLLEGKGINMSGYRDIYKKELENKCVKNLVRFKELGSRDAILYANALSPAEKEMWSQDPNTNG